MADYVETKQALVALPMFALLRSAQGHLVERINRARQEPQVLVNGTALLIENLTEDADFPMVLLFEPGREDRIRQEGYASGYRAGKSAGYDEGFAAGVNIGYDNGLAAGRAAGRWGTP